MIKDFFQKLCMPTIWFNISSKSKTLIVSLFLLYIFIGFALQQYFPFPYFIIFISMFLLIGFIGVLSISYFSKKISQISNSIVTQPFARNANNILYAFLLDNKLYVIVPLAVNFLFIYGGCKMFGAMQYNLSLFWILGLFFIVVYISMVGYLQYIALFIYIMKLAHSSESFGHIHHSPTECIPAELEWLQTLTKLYHVYRTSFFTLGSIYIIAFNLFCFLPKMKADVSSPYFFVLWTVIFVAIILLFPCSAILQYQWIKKIVAKLKKQYIADLSHETEIELRHSSNMQHKLFEIIYVMQIKKSADYPLCSMLNSGYNLCISLFNFIAAIITVLQGITIFPIDFLQIF